MDPLNHPFAIPVAIVVGAVVSAITIASVAVLNHFLELRKEKKILSAQDAKYLCDLINETRAMCVDYWHAPSLNNEKIVESSVTAMLFACHRMLASFPHKRRKSFKNLENDLVELRKLCTSVSYVSRNSKIDLSLASKIDRQARVLIADILAFRRV